MPKPMAKDNRITCPHCKVKTWSRDYTGFMRDHDRIDGRKCQKAAKDVKTQKPLAIYSVIVGNIGYVYRGESLQEANKAWGEYKRQSKEGYGRAGKEAVSMWCNGEIMREIAGEEESC